MTEIQALLLIKSILESADIHGIESFLAEAAHEKRPFPPIR